jgi:hypothetical protein
VSADRKGALAQLGEHLLCKQGVVGSIPTGSTTAFGMVGRRAIAEVVVIHVKIKVCSLGLWVECLPVLLTL